MTTLRVDTIALGPFSSNCHLLWVEGQTSAIVIDPGGEPGRLRARLQALRLVPAVLVGTHGHADHLGALADLAAGGVPVALHPAEADWAFSPANGIPGLIPPPAAPAGGVTRPLADGQTWTDAGVTWTVLHVPGHSPGGVALHLPEARLLVTGDTLFASGIGRTDLPGGDHRLLIRSLRRLCQLDPATRILPGHGPDSTIGQERKLLFGG